MHMVFEYIKRILAFLLCAFLFIISFDYITPLISLPILLIAFAFLHNRITAEWPPHLFAYYRTEAYFKKGGLRDLLRIFVTLFGFIYDTLVWLVWGVYLIFLLFTDLLYLVKSLLYWIIHAIVWFLSLYFPFLVFLYRVVIHYFFRWPWWLYQIAFYNMRNAYNRNFFRVALVGTLQALAIIFIFYYLEIFLDGLPGITFIGVVIALLPLTWSFGEIATIRVHKLENDTYSSIKPRFQNGLEAVRSVLFYITLFVVLLLLQLGLNLTGWIEDSGIIIAGFVFSINTLISLFLIFFCILIILGVMIIPSHRLYKPFSEVNFSHSFELLKFTGKKFIQYFVVLIPSILFSWVVMLLPLIVVMVAGSIASSLKSGITEVKIERLQRERVATVNADSTYFIEKRIENLRSIQQFPMNMVQEIEHRSSVDDELIFAREDLRSTKEKQLKEKEQHDRAIARLDEDIRQLTLIAVNNDDIDELNKEKENLVSSYSRTSQALASEEAHLRTDILYLMQKQKQLPLLLLLAGLWLIIFCSLILAFGIAYIGNVFHQVYLFRNNEDSSEWFRVIRDIKEKDQKQPLLGGTLFILTAVLIYLLVTTNNIINAVITSLVSF